MDLNLNLRQLNQRTVRMILKFADEIGIEPESAIVRNRVIASVL